MHTVLHDLMPDLCRAAQSAAQIWHDEETFALLQKSGG
jgi:hypothetical protein